MALDLHVLPAKALVLDSCTSFLAPSFRYVQYRVIKVLSELTSNWSIEPLSFKMDSWFISMDMQDGTLRIATAIPWASAMLVTAMVCVWLWPSESSSMDDDALTWNEISGLDAEVGRVS